MNNLKNHEGMEITKGMVFPMMMGHEWKEVDGDSLFKNKRVVVLGLPGAFTPTCSSSHLPRYEELYETFKAQGIDEIYCVSVNDTFVMNSWADAEEVKHVKMLPDGNGQFTKSVGMLVNKYDIGFGERSWRYSMLVDNGVVVKHFIEEDKEGDPFEVSDADTMIKYIAPNVSLPKSITIFTKKDCPFCKGAKELLQEKGCQYNEVELSDAIRQKVLRGMVGDEPATSPQVFIDGTRVGGLEGLKNYFN